jgi:hypothetical protein
LERLFSESPLSHGQRRRPPPPRQPPPNPPDGELRKTEPGDGLGVAERKGAVDDAPDAGAAPRQPLADEGPAPAGGEPRKLLPPAAMPGAVPRHAVAGTREIGGAAR